MLTPIGPAQTAEALALLTEGFPERDRAFWEKGFARLLAWPGNMDAGFAPGFLWLDKGVPVGILLTPASSRGGEGAQRRVLVNLSSWYVQPAYRWKAPLMLRELLRDDTVTFTDLTPTPDVQKMLPAFGFAPVNVGITLTPLPLQALQPGGGVRVRPWQPDDSLSAEAPAADLVALHQAWGHSALVMEQDGTRHLLVLKPFRYRGLPAAQAIYIGSHIALAKAMPTLARRLLAAGYLILQTDVRKVASPAAGFRGRGIWFARGESFADRTDHLGSELCFLDL